LAAGDGTLSCSDLAAFPKSGLRTLDA
jgi:hypothetical protein